MKHFKQITTLLLVAVLALTATALTSIKTYAAPPSNLEDEWREVYFNLGTSFRTYVHDDKLYFVNGENYTFNSLGRTEGQMLDLENSDDIFDALAIFFTNDQFFTKHVEAYDNTGKEILPLEEYAGHINSILGAAYGEKTEFEDFITTIFPKVDYLRLYIDLKDVGSVDQDGGSVDQELNYLLTKYLNHLVNFFKLNDSGSHWYFDYEYVQENFDDIQLANRAFQGGLVIDIKEELMQMIMLEFMGLTFNLFERYSKLEYSHDNRTFISVEPLNLLEIKHVYGYSLKMSRDNLKIIKPLAQITGGTEVYLSLNKSDTYFLSSEEEQVSFKNQLPTPTDANHNFLGWVYFDGTDVDLDDIVPGKIQNGIFANWEPKEDDYYDPLFVFENILTQAQRNSFTNEKNTVATITNQGAIRVENPYFEGVTEPLDPNPGLPGIIDNANNFVKDNLVFILLGTVVLISGALAYIKFSNKSKPSTNKKGKK